MTVSCVYIYIYIDLIIAIAKHGGLGYVWDGGTQANKWENEK